MTRAQQRYLAMTVLARWKSHQPVRRGALGLLAQLEAAELFDDGSDGRESGTVRYSASAPPRNRWDRRG